MYASMVDLGGTSTTVPWATERGWSLELAIYEDESSNSPRVKEGAKLEWQSHRNNMGSKEFEWVSASLETKYQLRIANVTNPPSASWREVWTEA